MFKICETSLVKKSCQFWEWGTILMSLMSEFLTDTQTEKENRHFHVLSNIRFLPFLKNKQIDCGIHNPLVGLHCNITECHKKPHWLAVRQADSQWKKLELFEIKQIFNSVKVMVFNLVYVQSKTNRWILPASKNLFWPTSSI